MRQMVPAMLGRSGQKFGGIVLACTLLLGAASAASAGQAPAPAGATSDAVLATIIIKADQTAGFEGVMTKLKEVLAKSEKAEWKAAAANWKLFKSADAPQGGNVVYVFVVDPAPKGADYSASGVINIFKEGAPNDALAQYNALKAAIVNWVLVNMQQTQTFGK